MGKFTYTIKIKLGRYLQKKQPISFFVRFYSVSVSLHPLIASSTFTTSTWCFTCESVFHLAFSKTASTKFLQVSFSIPLFVPQHRSMLPLVNLIKLVRDTHVPTHTVNISEKAEGKAYSYNSNYAVPPAFSNLTLVPLPEGVTIWKNYVGT